MLTRDATCGGDARVGISATSATRVANKYATFAEGDVS
jgi:hypothetical protein